MKKILLPFLLLMSVCGLAQAALVEKNVDYKAGDTTLKGYLVWDDAIEGKRPAVLVVHEWWGHNEYARDRARQLAELGYLALAVDMYGDGKLAQHPEEATKFYKEVMENMPAGKARFLAAMDVVNGHDMADGENIAAIGYCFGGSVVLQMAREGVDLDAVVSFHGALATAAPAKQGEVKAKILVAHGAADAMVGPDQVKAFMDEMNGAGADYTLLAYGGVQHSFTNPGADDVAAKFKLPLAYNGHADVDSWMQMQRMFYSAFK